MRLTPSVFYLFSNILLNKIGQDKLNKLRYVIFGGDVLNFAYLKSWFNIYGDKTPQLVNMYGITETTIHATYKFMKIDEIYDGSLIGRMLQGQLGYILDKYLNLLPIGAIGELYVSGRLAKGYLNKFDLTSQSFILKNYRK